MIKFFDKFSWDKDIEEILSCFEDLELDPNTELLNCEMVRDYAPFSRKKNYILVRIHLKKSENVNFLLKKLSSYIDLCEKFGYNFSHGKGSEWSESNGYYIQKVDGDWVFAGGKLINPNVKYIQIYFERPIYMYSESVDISDSYEDLEDLASYLEDNFEGIKIFIQREEKTSERIPDTIYIEIPREISEYDEDGIRIIRYKSDDEIGWSRSNLLSTIQNRLEMIIDNNENIKFSYIMIRTWGKSTPIRIDTCDLTSNKFKNKIKKKIQFIDKISIYLNILE